MSCRQDPDAERFPFTFRLNLLGYVVEWTLCASCLRSAFIDAVAGEFGDVTVLTSYDEEMTGIIYRPRKVAA